MSKTTKIAACAFIFALGVTAPSARAADPVPGACPKPGTTFTNSDGASITIGSGDGLWCSATSSKSGTFKMYGLLLRSDSQREPTAEGLEAVTKLWPLEVGKTAKYKLVRGSDAWSEEYKVVRQEPLNTAAGTFNAFVVTQREEGFYAMGTSRQFRGTYTIYIAPEVGYLVKFDFQMDSGSPRSSPPSWTLVSVGPPK